jgi:hypothetical protein
MHRRMIGGITAFWASDYVGRIYYVPFLEQAGLGSTGLSFFGSI